MKSEEISRRSFLKRALALSAVSAIPSFWTPAHGRVLPTSPLISANDRVNIAFIGIGQRGGEIAKELYNTGLCNVVALCDVDMGAPHTQEIINMFPKAARFQDFRTMFDRMADKIDAVSVGVPDHSPLPDHDRGDGARQTCICRETDGPHVPRNRDHDAWSEEIRRCHPNG